MRKFPKIIIGLLSTGILLFSGYADAKANTSGTNNFSAFESALKSGELVDYLCHDSKPGNKKGRLLKNKDVTRIYHDVIKANRNMGFRFGKPDQPIELYEMNPNIYVQDTTSATPSHTVGQCLSEVATIIISSHELMTAVYPYEKRAPGQFTRDTIYGMWKGTKPKRSLGPENIYTTSTMANSIAHEMAHNYLKRMGKNEHDEWQADAIGMELVANTQWYSPTAHNFDFYGYSAYKDAENPYPSDAEREQMKLNYIRTKTNGRVVVDKASQSVYIDGVRFDFLAKNEFTPSRYERTIQALGNVAYLYSKGISLMENCVYKTGDQLFHNGSKQVYSLVNRDKIGLPPKIVDVVVDINDVELLMCMARLEKGRQ